MSAPRRVLSLRFLLAALPMTLLAIGVAPAISALQSRFAKETIDLRVPLAEFDHDVLTAWTHRPDISPGHYDARAVGTDEYIYDTYQRTVDGRTVRAVLLVTYYSDPDDTIPHTPEVCYRQAGSSVDVLSTREITLPELGAVTARRLEVSQPTGAELHVLYVILHNGAIFHEREAVRLAMGLPGDRHTYFSKVEVAIAANGALADERLLATAEDLLATAFGELRTRHFPTDDVVRHGRPDAP